MVFEHGAMSYSCFFANCFAEYSGQRSGRDVAVFAEFCACAYATLGTLQSGSVCGTPSGVNVVVPGVVDAAVGCEQSTRDVGETSGVGLCADRVGSECGGGSGTGRCCDSGVVNSGEGKPRGKWFYSNKKKRDRRSKLGRMQNSWRSLDSGSTGGGDRSGAFWNSTDSCVRQELVDSKAKMHIAENKRRERKALDEIAYLDSPEAAMRKAISMIEYAEKQAKKENDNKVYGWARTVATSSAESLARSTPDSVPSFDDLSKKLEASSQSSFELELKAKQDELNKERVKHADELSLERAKHAAVVARVAELEKERVKPKNIPRKNFSDFMVDRARERERVIMSFHDEI